MVNPRMMSSSAMSITYLSAFNECITTTLLYKVCESLYQKLALSLSLYIYIYINTQERVGTIITYPFSIYKSIIMFDDLLNVMIISMYHTYHNVQHGIITIIACRTLYYNYGLHAIWKWNRYDEIITPKSSLARCG